MSIKITEHQFEYEGQKYFRRNAHALEAGHYGEKEDSLLSAGWLEPAGKVKPAHLDGRLKFNTRIRIDWGNVSEAELGADADLNYLGLGKSGMLSFNLSQARAAKLELVNLSIDESPLMRMLNNDAGVAREFLVKEGGDGRIISAIWFAVDAELGEHFATSGEAGVGVEAFGSTAGVVVSGGKHGTQTVQLSPGTTFAYRLHKVSDWNKGKTRVEKVEADYKGTA